MRRTLMTIGTALLLAGPAPVLGQDAQDALALGRGAEIWATNCVRCHNARPSVERTDAEWGVIVNHMRARANMTKTQARMATLFLRATNDMTTVVAVPQSPEPDAEATEASPAENVERSDGQTADGPPPRVKAQGGAEPSTVLAEHLREYLRVLQSGGAPPSR